MGGRSYEAVMARKSEIVKAAELNEIKFINANP